ARREGVIPQRERVDAGAQPAAPMTSESGSMTDEGASAQSYLSDPSMSSPRPRRDPEQRARLERFVAENGYHRQGELIADLLGQKLYRAVYGENQVAEVMTDFWFNHFNVSLTDPQARSYVLAYERDAIRPRALGSFGDLLAATARHPAMLL